MSISHPDAISTKFGTIPAILLKAENEAAPPLIPTDALAIQRSSEEDQLEEIAPPLTFEQHRWAGDAEASIDPWERSSGRRPKLIIGTAIVLGAFGGILYFLFPSENSPSFPRQETAVISRSEPSGPIPSIPSVPPQGASSSLATPQPSLPAESATTPPLGPVWAQSAVQAELASWPDPPSPAVQDSPRPSPIGPRDRTAVARPTTDGAAVRQLALGTQRSGFVFSQRPGVNVRSTPSLTGSVVGSVPKGTRFEVLEHNGEWVQVKSSSLQGWINARFTGPNAP